MEIWHPFRTANPYYKSMKNLFKILILSMLLPTIALCNQSVEYYETGEIEEIPKWLIKTKYD